MKLKFYRNLVLVILQILTLTQVQGQTPSERQTPQSFISSTAYPGVRFGYYEYLPEGYSIGSDFPVVIFLHGLGEKGNGTTDLYKLKANGLPKLIDAGTNFNFICISPQTNWPYNFESPVVSEIIEVVKSRYKINTNRIYLTGISFGGEACWAYGASSKVNSNKLAALVPIAGWLSNILGACNMNELPVWGFQGGNDGAGTIAAVNTLKVCLPAPNPTPKITVYPGVGHDCWDLTYTDQSFWDWLLAQSKTAPIQNQPPIVALNINSGKSSYVIGDTVSVTAIASDIDGTVQNVSLFNGSALIATDQTTPYSFNWINTLVGIQTLTAIASDNSGNKTTSNAIQVLFSAPVIKSENLAMNKPVTVSSISYRGREGLYAVDQNLSTYWNSSASDPIPTITVDLGASFFINEIVLKHAQVTGADKEFNTVDYKIECSEDGSLWTQLVSVIGNTSSITGYTIDSRKMRFVKLSISRTAIWPNKSAMISEIEVYGTNIKLPLISILSPVDNAVYKAGNNVIITTEASYENGSITLVNFYNDNVLIGSSNTAPYSFTWQNVPTGTFELKAVAISNDGFSSTSTGVSITVNPPDLSINLAKNKPFSVSSTVNYNGFDGSKALDGLTNTTWNSDPKQTTHWFKVDLSALYAINQIILRHAQAAGSIKEFNSQDFKIEYSSDNNTWTELINITGNSLSVTSVNLANANLRYVRVYITKTAVWPGKSAIISELEVYGTSGARIGLEENFNMSKAKISPNPSNGEFSVTLSTNDEHILFIVYDVLGNEILKTERAGNLEKYDFVIPNIKSGIYYLKTSNSKASSSFVIY